MEGVMTKLDGITLVIQAYSVGPPFRKKMMRLFSPYAVTSSRYTELEDLGDRAPNLRVCWAIYGLRDGLQDIEGDKPPSEQALVDAYQLGASMGHEFRRRMLDCYIRRPPVRR